METKAHYSPWESASSRGSGRPGRRGAVDGGGIYNLCLVPARLDAHSRFPSYNKIKQLRDISLLLADEILASADLLRPAWGCSLFLHSKTWRVAAAVYFAPKLGICSFFPPHSHLIQSLWARGRGLGLWHLPHLSFLPSPTSKGAQLCLMGHMWTLPMDVTATGAGKQELAPYPRARFLAGVCICPTHPSSSLVPGPDDKQG